MSSQIVISLPLACLRAGDEMFSLLLVRMLLSSLSRRARLDSFCRVICSSLVSIDVLLSALACATCWICVVSDVVALSILESMCLIRLLVSSWSAVIFALVVVVCCSMALSTSVWICCWMSGGTDDWSVAGSSSCPAGVRAMGVGDLPIGMNVIVDVL